MAAQTIPIDPVEDDGALLKEKKPNRIMQVLSMLPFGDTVRRGRGCCAVCTRPEVCCRGHVLVTEGVP